MSNYLIDDLIRNTHNILHANTISSQKLRKLIVDIEHAYDAKLTEDLRSILEEISVTNELTVNYIGRAIGIKTKSLVVVIEELAKDANRLERFKDRTDLILKLEEVLKEVDIRYQRRAKQNRKELEKVKSDLIANAKISTDKIDKRPKAKLIRQDAFYEKLLPESKEITSDRTLIGDHISLEAQKIAIKYADRKKSSSIASSSVAASVAPVEEESIKLDYIKYISNDHGQETSRDITILNGIPFYKSSGQNSGLAETWFPFKGLLSEPALDLNGLPFNDSRNVPGFFIKPNVNPFKRINYIPKDILRDLASIDKDLPSRLPCLYHVLLSSVLGEGVWKSEKAKKLKQKLMQQYPGFYELNQNIQLVKCIKTVDDYQVEKDLSREQLMSPQFYQNANFHSINDWLKHHGKRDKIILNLEEQKPLLETSIKSNQEVGKDKPKKKVR